MLMKQKHTYPIPPGAKIVEQDGVMSVIATADGQVESTVSLRESVTASPAVLGARIYLRTTDHLVCIGKD
jgi:hypothetical protein